MNNSPDILTIGVLAIQGGFAEHMSHLGAVNKLLRSKQNLFPVVLKVVEVRCAGELMNLDGIVIPGGETTVISVFLEKNNCELLNALKKFAKNKPIFGTCAGMIMLANEVEKQKEDGQIMVGGMDIKVRRNYFGSQLQSFEAYLDFEDEELLKNETRPMLFIRAPGILDLDKAKVKVLAKHNDCPVAVRQNNLLATSFHPELTQDLSWHLYFVKMMLQYKSAKA